jgi:hypothetical protein
MLYIEINYAVEVLYRIDIFRVGHQLTILNHAQEIISKVDIFLYF